jgi:hypothetical protein
LNRCFRLVLRAGYLHIFSEKTLESSQDVPVSVDLGGAVSDFCFNATGGKTKFEPFIIAHSFLLSVRAKSSSSSSALTFFFPSFTSLPLEFQK